MAVYKVPQDVEADDKLIGPFSFRQFIYLIIVAISIAIGWGLSRLLLPLAIIPLPIVLLFGALALPLKKDQPMEIYLAAVISFYLKPRRRLWQPDGIQSLVEITAPKVIEVKRAKDLSQAEAQQRLSYLANIVDTEGWAVRGVDTNTPMQNDAYYEAQQQEDVLDASSGVAQSFDSMINQADLKRRQEMVQRMHQTQTPQVSTPVMPTQNPNPPVFDPYASLSTPLPAPSASVPVNEPRLTYNPYPTSIHQSVINPLGSQPITEPMSPPPSQPAELPTPPPVSAQITSDNNESTSEKPISPDIISLANNSDLSIETIAHEANRIHQKEEEQHLPDEEVVISLR